MSSELMLDLLGYLLFTDDPKLITTRLLSNPMFSYEIYYYSAEPTIYLTKFKIWPTTWLGTESLIFCPCAEGRLSSVEMLLCALVKHISSQDFDNDRPNSHHYQPPKFTYWLCLAKIAKWTSFTTFGPFPCLTTTKNILNSYKGIWPLNFRWLSHENNF